MSLPPDDPTPCIEVEEASVSFGPKHVLKGVTLAGGKSSTWPAVKTPPNSPANVRGERNM